MSNHMGEKLESYVLSCSPGHIQLEEKTPLSGGMFKNYSIVYSGEALFHSGEAPKEFPSLSTTSWKVYNLFTEWVCFNYLGDST